DEEHEAAAAWWEAHHCSFEAALALTDSESDSALHEALSRLQEADARPAAAIVARRLRDRGARGLPRGPRPATRGNPAGLTPREVEVLQLVVQGLRNAEIADRRGDAGPDRLARSQVREHRVNPAAGGPGR